MDGRLSKSELMQQHGSHLRSNGGLAAFDALITVAAGLQQYRVYLDRDGDIRVFPFQDGAKGQRLFAFIVNRSDLLFHVRKPGRGRVPGRFKDLQTAVPRDRETNAGEWTMRLANAEDVERLVRLLFAEPGTASGGEPW